MNILTPALLTLLLLVLGAALSRFAPRQEARAVAVAHAGLSLCAALTSALFDHGAADATAEHFAGLLTLTTAVNTMLAPLAATALALVLAMPEREAGHRTVAQSLGLPALVVLSLLVDSIAAVVALDALIAAVVVSATEPRARRVQALVRGGGVVMAVIGCLLLPPGILLAPVADAVPHVGLAAAIWMLAGVLLQLGVGPASIGLRAAVADGLTGRALLTTLPLGGMSLLLRVAGPTFGHAASPEQSHVALLVVLCCALLTAAMVLVQRKAGGAFALLLATSAALSSAGLLELDAGASLGGELLWAATLLAGAGLGVTLITLRARHGRLRLGRFSGYWASSPRLGGFVLFFAVALGGLPGTLDFAALDLILHGDVSHHLDTLVVGALALAVAGFAAVSVAFHLLFGAPPRDDRDDDLPLLRRERYALLPLAVLLLVAGLVPQVVPVVRMVEGRSRGGEERLQPGRRALRDLDDAAAGSAAAREQLAGPAARHLPRAVRRDADVAAAGGDLERRPRR